MTARKHVHTIDCYASNDLGPLAYTPCRTDGLDRNLRNLKEVDFVAMPNETRKKCLTLICKLSENESA